MTPPKGKPTTSTERMRLKRERELGNAPPVKTCAACGKKLKQGAGSNRAYDAGLCWEHWRQSPEGKIERRKSSLVSEKWGVCYFGGEKLVPHTSLRAALSESVRKGGRENLPIFVVWSDGTVTMHLGLTARKSAGLKPDDGDLLIDEFEDFLDMVPDHLKTWFDN